MSPLSRLVMAMGRELPARILAAALLIGVAAPAGAAEAPVPAADLSAEAWAGRARAALRDGDVFGALEAFGHAVAVDGGRPDLRLEYAWQLKKTGFWLRSAEQFLAVLKADPGNVEANLGYGELLNSQYQFAAAAEQFSHALSLALPPHSRERALVGLGSSYFGLEDYAAAAVTFEALLQDRPEVLSALAFLAAARTRLGDLEEAERLWSLFLEKQPGASRARIHRIEVQELRAGIAGARQAVAASPDNPAAWSHLGDLLRRQPDLSGARDAFYAAARLAPSEPYYNFSLGAVLRDLGLYEAAAAGFSAVQRESLYGAPALYNLAFCARKAGDRRREAKAWRDAVILSPDDAYAYRRYLGVLIATEGLDLERARVMQSGSEIGARGSIRRALVHQAAGEIEAARVAALEALDLDLNDVSARRLLRDLVHDDEAAATRAIEALGRGDRSTAAGRREMRMQGALLLALEKPAEAEAAFRGAIVSGEPDARLLVSIASCRREQGRVDEALELIREAVDADPDYLYARLDLALVLIGKGDPAGAREAAEKSIAIAPRNPIGYSLLGAALQDAGDLAGAAAALERAVSLDPMDELGAPRLLLAKVHAARGDPDRAKRALVGDLPQDPVEIYRMAWEFIRDTYHDHSYNGQDWSVWRDRYEGRLRTTAEALGAVATMLSSLDDRNTRLRSAEQTAALLFTQRTDAPEFSPDGAALMSSKTVESSRLEDNVGYIAITNLYDPKLPEEIRKAVESMKTADGIILDLRGNQGGADDDVPQIAGMFLEPGTRTGTLVGPDGPKTSAAEPPPGAKGPLVSADKPVVVLVDRHTASSAENLAGSLKEARRAVLVGEKTYGKSGVQMPKLLPGGTIVLVVGAEHADLGGAVYTGVGIRPDVRVENASGREGPGGDAALDKAKDLIRRPKGGS